MCVQGVQQGRYRRRHDGYRRVVDVVKTEFNIRLSRTALKPRDGVGTTVRGNRRVRAAAALGNNSQTPANTIRPHSYQEEVRRSTSKLEARAEPWNTVKLGPRRFRLAIT